MRDVGVFGRGRVEMTGWVGKNLLKLTNGYLWQFFLTRIWNLLFRAKIIFSDSLKSRCGLGKFFRICFFLVPWEFPAFFVRIFSLFSLPRIFFWVIFVWNFLPENFRKNFSFSSFFIKGQCTPIKKFLKKKNFMWYKGRLQEKESKKFFRMLLKIFP